MNYTLEKLPKKYVVGWSLRTSNARIKDEAQTFWSRFCSSYDLEKIPHRANSNMIAVYTDYEGDYTQEYTYFIGCEVTNLDDIPTGMLGKTIPASRYAVFTASGLFPQSLHQVWQTIWATDLDRAYTSDFEIYTPEFRPHENSEIKVYIAIKNNTLKTRVE